MDVTRTMVGLALVGSLVVTGCKQNPPPTVEAVPPPPPRSFFEPVATEPTPTAPVFEAMPAEPAPAMGAAPAAGGTYTVQKGDTMIKIARQVYGRDAAWRDIAAANPTVDPAKMKLGTVLVLP